MDFFGPLTETKYGYEYILVMMDTFTKYTKLYPLKQATTEAAIRSLESFTASIGKPERILADKGTQFTNKELTEALKEMNIRLVATSRPQDELPSGSTQNQARRVGMSPSSLRFHAFVS